MKPGGNPFKFGSIVQGRDFVDRDTERVELKTHIQNHTNIILYAPRRYGKSSLIYETLAEMEQGNPDFVGLVIDFYAVHSREKFLELLANQVFKKTGWSFEHILDLFRQTIRGIHPALTSDESGTPRLEIGFSLQQQAYAFEDIVNLPRKLSEQGKLVCVVFDEFQEITRLNGRSFQRELRSRIQHHNEVSYIFSGSKQHLVSELFMQSSAPLYNFGRMWALDKIPAGAFIPFLQKHLKTVKPGFSAAEGGEIYALGEGVPFYIQFIAYEYFNLALAQPELAHAELLERARKRLIESQSAEFLSRWEKLNASQKHALEIVLKTRGESLFGKENLSRFNIAASTLKKALTQLQRFGFLEQQGKQVTFQNVFFKHWLTAML